MEREKRTVGVVGISATSDVVCECVENIGDTDSVRCECGDDVELAVLDV